MPMNESADMMSFSQSPKRPRIHFLWRRILHSSEEYAPLKLREKPNLNVLRMMLDMNRDDDTVRQNARLLSEYENEMIEAGDERDCYYKQKSIAEFCTDGYAGAKLIGRSYTGSKLNWMPRRLVNTMYRNTHQEIDLRCSYQTMIYNAFDHIDLPATRLLLRNPTEIMSAIAHETRLSIDTVKRGLLAAMCSIPTVDYGFENPDSSMDEIRRFCGHRYVMEYVGEMGRVAKELRIVYPEFYATISRMAAAHGKTSHVDGLALSYLAMDMEHAVMRFVIDRFPMDVPDMIWYFDGVMIPNRYVSNVEGVCDMLQTKIRENFDIRCEFRVKDVAANSIAWSLGPDELSNENMGYNRWKLRFEKKMCTFDNPPKFCHFYDGNKFQFLGKEGFQHVTSSENQDYIKQWLHDGNKRHYKTIEFAPPPLVHRPGNFNPWDGFAAEALPPIEDTLEVETLIGPYKRHVHLLCGEDASYADYMHKLIAFKIQKPGLRWGVLPYFFSAQGVGKDQWFIFISKIVGSKYCYTATNFGELRGTATSLIDNKLFVCFSEMCAEDSNKNTEFVKRLITSDTLLVEAKYVPQYENRSCHAFLGFTNYMNAINYKSDDRRFVAFQSSGKYRNDPEYHGPFNDYIHNPVNQRAVYQWLLNMDISGFEPMRERVKTEMHAEVADYQKPMFDIFLEKHWDEIKMNAQVSNDFKLTRLIDDNRILELNSSVIQDQYGIFLRDEMKLADMTTGSKIAKTFSKHSMEASSRLDKYKVLDQKPVTQKRYKDRNMYQFDVAAIEKYIDIDIRHNDQGGEVEEEEIPDGYVDRSNFVVGFTGNSR